MKDFGTAPIPLRGVVAIAAVLVAAAAGMMVALGGPGLPLVCGGNGDVHYTYASWDDFAADLRDALALADPCFLARLTEGTAHRIPRWKGVVSWRARHGGPLELGSPRPPAGADSWPVGPDGVEESQALGAYAADIMDGAGRVVGVARAVYYPLARDPHNGPHWHLAKLRLCRDVCRRRSA